ncbi:MAG: hypothetical protein P4L49_01405 [Desulfosporosinus sp.]|nr:hypothetical protein [Desulfosporosinus sp.]
MVDFKTQPNRILGMQKLEAFFNKTGYLTCQFSGKRIYNFDEVAAIFIPLSPLTDQVMAVHSDYAKVFMQSLLLSL